MIALALPSGVEPVTAVKPAGAGRGEAQPLLPQFEPGQILSARVEARLSDGSFIVNLAGQALRMALPDYVAPGDTLELAFLTDQPRLTFALKDAGTAAQLSGTGRLIAAMLPPPGAPAVAVAATAAPLLAAPPADAARLATALEHALAHSGLFYEAHQAEWVAGQRDLGQLRQEPQAHFAPATAPPLTPTGRDATAAPAAAGHAQPMLHAQGISLVQQQLAALESSRIVLQLELWPGQWMQWAIEEHTADAAPARAPAQGWRTQLRLSLPQLGEVDAILALADQGVHIRLNAASDDSAHLMQQHRPALHAALAEAGIAPAAIAVNHHGPS